MMAAFNFVATVWSMTNQKRMTVHAVQQLQKKDPSLNTIENEWENEGCQLEAHGCTGSLGALGEKEKVVTPSYESCQTAASYYPYQV